MPAEKKQEKLYKFKKLKGYPDISDLKLWSPSKELYAQVNDAPDVELEKENSHLQGRELIRELCIKENSQGLIGLLIIQEGEKATGTIYLVPAYNRNDLKKRYPFSFILNGVKHNNFFIEGSEWGQARSGTTHVNALNFLFQKGIIPYNSDNLKDGFILGFGIIVTANGFIFLNKSANSQIPAIEYNEIYTEIYDGFNRTSDHLSRYLPKDISETIISVLVNSLKINPQNVLRDCLNYEYEDKFLHMSQEKKVERLFGNYMLLFQKENFNSLKTVNFSHLKRITRLIQQSNCELTFDERGFSIILDSLLKTPNSNNDILKIINELQKIGLNLKRFTDFVVINIENPNNIKLKNIQDICIFILEENQSKKIETHENKEFKRKMSNPKNDPQENKFLELVQLIEKQNWQASTEGILLATILLADGRSKKIPESLKKVYFKLRQNELLSHSEIKILTSSAINNNGQIKNLISQLHDASEISNSSSSEFNNEETQENKYSQADMQHRFFPYLQNTNYKILGDRQLCERAKVAFDLKDEKSLKLLINEAITRKSKDQNSYVIDHIIDFTPEPQKNEIVKNLEEVLKNNNFRR